jgi:hypothetical protein
LSEGCVTTNLSVTPSIRETIIEGIPNDSI